MSILSEQEIIRRQSLQALTDSGVNPYPSEAFAVTHHSIDIKQAFTDEDAADWQEVRLAGRLMSRRIMGKASFAELQDAKGRIQLYLNRDELCPGEDKSLYNEVFKKLSDIGDFIGIKGFVFRTQVGEISVHVQELTTAAGGEARRGRAHLRRIYRS
jgi:lysyl-tRNA synthetase class 2